MIALQSENIIVLHPEWTPSKLISRIYLKKVYLEDLHIQRDL